jgi:hypothetical protein
LARAKWMTEPFLTDGEAVIADALGRCERRRLGIIGFAAVTRP